MAFPDTLVGTDSHTTMINGLGVLGWGVGGHRGGGGHARASRSTCSRPQVVGFRLTGALREGVTATDLVLTVTQMLRKKGVVEKFVEFFGPGLGQMSLADRATIANMAPEYGATCGFFPVDDETLRYLRRTGPQRPGGPGRALRQGAGTLPHGGGHGLRSSRTRSRWTWRTVEPSLAGPKRPQDRVALAQMKTLVPAGPHRARQGARLRPGGGRPRPHGHGRDERGASTEIGHGAVVIAAITSCTNTSNPSVMLGAGLLAKKADERGLRPPAYVKTSLAPGSKVVTEYYNAVRA